MIDKALLYFRSQVVLQDVQCAISPMFKCHQKETQGYARGDINTERQGELCRLFLALHPG